MKTSSSINFIITIILISLFLSCNLNDNKTSGEIPFDTIKSVDSVREYVRKERKPNTFRKFELVGKIKLLTETSYWVKEKFGDYVKGGMREQLIYKYDNNNNIVEYVRISPGFETITKKYLRDKNGQILDATEYNESSEKISRRTYKYSENGEWAYSMHYEEQDNGKLTAKCQTRYNEYGDEVEEICDGQNPNPWHKKSSYERELLDNGYTQKEETEISENGIVNLSRSSSSFIKVVYDFKENTMTLYIDYEKASTTFYKDFDIIGNWQNAFHKDESNYSEIEPSHYIVERTIEYY